MTDEQRDDSSRGTWRTKFDGRLGDVLELVALAAFAIAQPVLDVFGRAPETFLSEGATRAGVIEFGLIVVLLPIVVLAAIDVVAGLISVRVHRVVHLALIGLLVAMIAVPIARDATSWSSNKLAIVGVLAGAGAIVVYSRLQPVRLFLRYAAIAPVVFLALFLLSSPASSLVTGSAEKVPAVDTAGNPPSVVFLMLDELPLASLLDGKGEIDETLFPNFARLAASSTWYRNTSTVAPYTDAAVPALLSGRLPASTSVVPPTNEEHPQNLFNMLGSSYDFHVSEPVTRLCPPRLCGSNAEAGALGRLLKEAGRVVYDRAQPWRKPRPTEFAFMAGKRLDRDRVHDLREYVDAIQPVPPGDKPRLDYAHVMIPHPPWLFVPGTDETNEPTGPAVGILGASWGSDHTAELARRRHLLQVQVLDAELGHLLDRLEETGRDQNSMLVVTSDHGAGFVSREPFRGVAEENQEQLAWVPLFVRMPGQTKGTRTDRNAWSTDIVPTIADAVGAEVPWRTDGSSLSEPAQRPADDKRLLDWRSSRLHPEDGDFLRLDVDALFPEVLASGVGGEEGDPYRLYRYTAHGDLIGRRIDELDVGEPPPYQLRLDDPDAFRAVDVDALAPVYVVAHYIDGQPAGAHEFEAAVAVNGRIAGVGRNILSFGAPPLGIHALVPPDLLRDGDNDVRLYEVVARAGGVTLRPLTP